MTTSPGAGVPSISQVTAIICRVEPSSVLVAAAHLLTPVTVAVGLHVLVSDTHVRWRGEVVQVSGALWADSVQAVAELVARARTEGDTFLALTEEPGSWLKFVRSGAFVHLAGARELFGSQHVTFAPSVPLGVARSIAGLVADRRDLTSGLLHLDGRVLRVRADRVAAHVELV